MLRRAYIEITNICNLKCPFCPGTGRAARWMTAAEFAAAAAKIRPYTEYLCLHLMGEPLTHPELGEILGEAERQGFSVTLTTNGILLPGRRDVLAPHPLYKISVSLHAWEANFGAEMTDAARRYFGECFAFAAEAAAHGTIAALRLWNGDRADRTGANTMNDAITALARDVFPGEWADTPRGIRLAQRVYIENETIFDWPDETAEARDGRASCWGTRDHIGILSDGTVVPCCLDHEGTIRLGNIFTDDLGGILASRRVTAMREGFLRGEAVEPYCRRCGRVGK